MTWFEVGLGVGLGLIAAAAITFAVVTVLAALYVTYTEHKEARDLAKWFEQHRTPRKKAGEKD